MSAVLYIVVPCYNEEEVLPGTITVLGKKLEMLIKSGSVSSDSRLLFVDDGSRDSTWSIIRSAHESSHFVCGLKLSRNRGHQNALLAGLMKAKELCDISISIDADLQDDINAIDSFIDKYNEGCDIVYGVRSDRSSDGIMKRATAQGFYKFMDLMGANTIYNHADFRLMSKRALEGLAGFGEVNLYLRGIVPMIGYKTDTVEYSRQERAAGESKYSPAKMLNLAFDGLTSFSLRPLRFITAAGILIFGISLVWAIVLLIMLIAGKAVSGFNALAMCIWAVCGIIVTCIGIVGEYVGKINLETRSRPKYIIETSLIK